MTSGMPTTVGFGVSDTLCSIFDGLTQAEGRYGQKYRDADINKVKQYVSCRNYSKATLELVYLCWGIVNAYPVRRGIGSIEAFFWLDEAYSSQRCRAAFSQLWQGEAGQVCIGKEHLELKVGSKVFNISPARVSVLAVLMEFIVTVDPRLLSMLSSSLLSCNDKTIETLAKKIQQNIYQFLKAHLPEAQIQTRYRYFELWLKAQSLSPSNVNDETILQFWQEAGDDPQAQSYVLYATALFDVLDALRAMKTVESQQAVAFAVRFGFDLDAGELNPEQLIASQFDEVSGDQQYSELHSLVFSDESNVIPLATLSQSPKCLSQDEVQSLQPLLDYCHDIQRFLRSFMRLQVFARWQSILVQAKRKSAQQLAAKLSEVPVQGYAMYQLDVTGLHQTLDYAETCLLHVLVELVPELGCREVLQKLPAEEFAKVALWLRQQANPQSPTVLSQLSLQFPTFRLLLNDLHSAFKKNNKAGFKTLPQRQDIERYINALQLVRHLLTLTTAHEREITQLIDAGPSLSRIFSSDVCIFTDRFNQLYGGGNAN